MVKNISHFWRVIKLASLFAVTREACVTSFCKTWTAKRWKCYNQMIVTKCRSEQPNYHQMIKFITLKSKKYLFSVLTWFISTAKNWNGWNSQQLRWNEATGNCIAISWLFNQGYAEITWTIRSHPNKHSEDSHIFKTHSSNTFCSMGYHGKKGTGSWKRRINKLVRKI